MSFKSFLSSVGHDFVKVFSWLGSPKGQAVIGTVEAVTVAIDPALAGIEALVNTGLKSVISIESVAAAAGQQTGTGAQKSAAVVASIAPQVENFLKSIGIANPAAADVQKYATSISDALVAILNSIPAPTA